MWDTYKNDLNAFESKSWKNLRDIQGLNIMRENIGISKIL